MTVSIGMLNAIAEHAKELANSAQAMADAMQAS